MIQLQSWRQGGRAVIAMCKARYKAEFHDLSGIPRWAKWLAWGYSSTP